jgi:hypothetical protein
MARSPGKGSESGILDGNHLREVIQTTTSPRSSKTELYGLNHENSTRSNPSGKPDSLGGKYVRQVIDVVEDGVGTR